MEIINQLKNLSTEDKLNFISMIPDLQEAIQQNPQLAEALMGNLEGEISQIDLEQERDHPQEDDAKMVVRQYDTNAQREEDTEMEA